MEDAPSKLERLRSRLAELAEANETLLKDRDKYRHAAGKLKGRVENLEGQLGQFEGELKVRRSSRGGSVSPPASPPTPPPSEKWRGGSPSIPSPPSGPSLASSPARSPPPPPKPSAPRPKEEYTLYTPQDTPHSYRRSKTPSPMSPAPTSPPICVVERYVSEIAYLREQLDRANVQVAEKGKAHCVAEESLVIRDAEVEGLREKLKAVEVELAARRGMKSMATRREREEVARLREKVGELEAEGEKGRSDQVYHGYVRKELEKVKGELRSVNDTCEEKKRDVTRLEKEVGEVKRMALQEQATQDAAVTSLKAQLSGYHSCLEASHSKLRALLSTTPPAADLLFAHPELVDHLASEVTNTRGQREAHREAADENNMLKSQISSWQTQAKVAREKQNRAEEGLRVLEKHNKAKTDEVIGGLKRELKECREALRVAESQVLDLTDAAEYQVSVDTECSGEVDRLREELRKKTMMVKEIRRVAEGRLRKYEKELDDLKQNLSNTRMDKDVAVAEAERYKASCERLHTELRVASQVKSDLSHQLRVARDASLGMLPHAYDDNINQSFEVSMLQSLVSN